MWEQVREPRKLVEFDAPDKHPDDGRCVFVIRYGALNTFLGDHGTEEENVYDAKLFDSYRSALKRVTKIVHAVNRDITWYNDRHRLQEQSPDVESMNTMEYWLKRPLFYDDGTVVEPIIVAMSFETGSKVFVSLCEK